MASYNIDIETYSEVDLTKVGVHVYAAHPSTRIDLVAWCDSSGIMQQIDLTSEDRYEAYRRLKNLGVLLESHGNQWHAFNATFEIELIKRVWGLNLIIDNWHCTMIHAWSLGFSGGLKAVGAALGMSDEMSKTDGGKKLVLKFCKPAPKSHKVEVYNGLNSPELWDEYCEYNRQDVVAEAAILRFLEHYPIAPKEREAWLLDYKINNRGLPIDMDLVNNAVKLVAEEKGQLLEAMVDLTGLANPASGPQLMGWLQDNGVNLPNLQKQTIIDFLANADPFDETYKVLVLKQQISQTSIKKFEVAQRATGSDGRMRGVFQFGGAQRTQRWAGRLFQPHNMRRGYSDADQQAGTILSGDRALCEIVHGPVLDYLANCMRTVITASPGNTLVVCDYGSVESRIAGWLSGCMRLNTLFAGGKDGYKDFASSHFNVDYDDVTKAQRAWSKPATLGCTFQLGGKGLVGYADGMGVTLTEGEADLAVATWREAYPEIPVMWYWLLDAFKHCTQTGQECTGYRISMRRDENFLFIRLPSGRDIAYYKPEIIMQVPPWGGDPRATASYMGLSQKTFKWERITTHGGKITENICQAVARDLLSGALIEGDKDGLTLVGHVHDEMIAETPIAGAEQTLAYMEHLMLTMPEWAKDMIMGNEGFITKRYRK